MPAEVMARAFEPYFVDFRRDLTRDFH